MQSTRTPIFIQEESQKSLKILRGLTEKYRLKVTNSDSQELNIVLWIKANDSRSKPIERWCTIIDERSSINNRLRLKPEESQSIEIQFEVPQQASPGTYHYTVFAEAPEQYPDQVFRRPQQLRVRLERETESDYEPEFILPSTNPNKPHELQAGEKVEIPIQIKNRSKLVDRFYIICPDLDEDWYDVRYPEVNTNLPGLIRETDGLELNPEDPPGEIQLILHPPKYTPAGNYFPTIQLISKNNESQLIIRVFYLLILPEYNLQCTLQPTKNKVKEGKADFDIKLTNEGNTRRDLILATNFIQQEKLWNYVLSPQSDVRIFPSKSKTINLQVERKGWRWRRLIPRPPLELPFDVELEDVQNLPLEEPSLEGILVWDKSPWWHLWLLILLVLSLLAGTALAIWWNFFKMPPLPKINQFSTINKLSKYQEGVPIKINWEIRHPQELEKIVFTRIDSQGSSDLKSYLFDNEKLNLPELVNKNHECKLIEDSHSNLFKKTIDKLFRKPSSNTENDSQNQKECKIEAQNKSQCALECTLTLTPLPPDKYIFEIEAFPKSIDQLFRKRSSKKSSDSSKTDTIEVTPKPQPILSQINKIASSKSTYSRIQQEEIILQFDITNQSQLNQIEIITQDGDRVTRAASYILKNGQIQPKDTKNLWGDLVCEVGDKSENLSCKWSLNTGLIEPGNYTFKVAVYSLSNLKEASDSQALQNTIVVQPAPLPEIEQFTASKAVYEEAKKEPIILQFDIKNRSQLTQFEIITQDSNQVTKAASYSYIQDLENAQILQKDTRNLLGKLDCKVANNPENLSCQWSLNTSLIEPGNHTFKVAVYSLSNQKEPSDSQALQNTIVVQPEPLPEIKQFTVSKEVYEEAQKEPIKLNWVIQNPNQIKLFIITAQDQNGSSQEVQRYQYPSQVSSFCSISQAVDYLLICRDVPIKNFPPGEHTFQLEVISKKAEENVKFTKISPPVKVTPTPIKIEFKVNDQLITQPVVNYPPIAISSPVFIQLGWKVEGGEGIQVELQPLADVVEKEGSMTYMISQAPFSETITLQVTNSLGEQESRSIMIQTYQSSSSSESSSPSQFSFPQTGELETPESDVVQPVPTRPGSLEPIEIPPKSD
ncbi:MAG: hypothetical protein F6K22_02020 [Okeania sp. SIO2F4]|uniref:COG1470 family protein n=1 Tax=Okeania sp. SIO2F4 TaxID=2607790 RepID=UPI00142CDA7F|nr:hypothetical protein [Okeania sp. SIO2F4]NES01703.1 hypothetical protein [Okeania sp. SIO2F4]